MSSKSLKWRLLKRRRQSETREAKKKERRIGSMISPAEFIYFRLGADSPPLLVILNRSVFREGALVRLRSTWSVNALPTIVRMTNRCHIDPGAAAAPSRPLPPPHPPTDFLMPIPLQIRTAPKKTKKTPKDSFEFNIFNLAPRPGLEQVAGTATGAARSGIQPGQSRWHSTKHPQHGIRAQSPCSCSRSNSRLRPCG